MNKGIIIIILTYLLLTPFLLTVWIHSNDAVGHYSYLHSVVIDKDLDLHNEYDHYIEVFPTIRKEYSSTNKVINRYGVGSAVLWSPFFIVAHILTQGDGYGFWYVFAITFASSLYVLLGLLMMYDLLKQYFGAFPALIAVYLSWFATPLLFYMWLQPSVSHASSFFAVTLFIWYWHKTWKSRSYRQWVILGVMGGVMTMVRVQDGLFMIIPLLEVFPVYFRNIKNFPFTLFKKNIIFLLSITIGLLPQLITYKFLTGSFFAAAQTAKYNPAWLLQPINFFKVLFLQHGLFSWTPIWAVATIGLFWWWFKDKNKLAMYITVAFLLQLYLMSTWEGWFGAAAFGQRKFLNSTLIFSFGIAYVIKRFEKHKVIVLLFSFLFISWNIGLLVQYGSRMIPAEAYVSLKEITKNNFTKVPQKLVKILKTFLFDRKKFLIP
jgi:hypothetical protein